MSDMKEMNLEEMGQVAGGVKQPVMIAASLVFNGPGTQYAQIATISSGCLVTPTGSELPDTNGNVWYEISSPTRGWICKSDPLQTVTMNA